MSRHVAAQVLWDYFHISPSSLQVFDTSEIFKYGVLGLFIRLSAPVASNGQVSSQRAEKKKTQRKISPLKGFSGESDSRLGFTQASTLSLMFFLKFLKEK